MGENRAIETKEQVNALKQGERTAGISTLTIILLAAAEAMVGILSANIILITDAFGLKIS